MKTKPTKNEKIAREWVVNAQNSLPDDILPLYVVEPQLHAQKQKLFEDRLKEIDDYKYYLEFSKKAPSKEQQADFLEKMYGLLLRFTHNLIIDDKNCYEKFERPRRLEIERLKHQSFN